MSIEDYKARPIITLKLGPLKTYRFRTSTIIMMSASSVV